MSGFTLFRRGECPVCSGASKGCRKSNLTNLLFCRNREAQPPNYIYKGEDAHGFGIWQAVEDAQAFTSQASEEKERRRREFLEAKERRRQLQIQKQLPAVKQDKWYSLLLGELSLTERDFLKLLERGLTPEQIVKDGYKSVSKWQKLNKTFPLDLPGVLPNGVLNVPGDGILCPIRNRDGLIVACQVRLHDGTDGRYRWLTSATKKNPDGATSHLNGELPIGVFEPENFTGDSIWLTEGTSIKPSLTRYRLDVPVLGASSGRFDSSPETSKKAIAYLSGKYQTKLLTFAVDAGDVVNRCGVPQRWQQQIEFFSSLGYQCRVAWWGQITKNDCDIDELSDTSGIRYISTDEFWSIVEEHKSGKGFAQPKIKPDSDNSPVDYAFHKWVRSRKFTPTITINQDEFSFPEILINNAIYSVNSGMGTGKTKAILKVIKDSPNRAILLGCLNNLLSQTISRGSENGVTIYHLHMDEASNLVADENTNMACCVNSMQHLDGYFKGVDLYIDEICSVIESMLSGGTLGDRQAYIMKVFERAIKEADRVFILDANNNDLITEFISDISPDKQVIKILNTAKPRPHHFKFVDGYDPEKGEIKKRDKSPLTQMICDAKIKPWIASDSKKMVNAIAEIVKDEKTGKTLTSDTVSEDWAKAFLSNPDSFLANDKPDYFAISPTANSGISVTNSNSFTDKITIFTGVLTTNQQTQILLRLRPNNLGHYIFCPEHTNIRNNEKYPTVEAYCEKTINKISLSARLANDGNQSMAEVISNAVAKLQDRWFELSAKLGVADNYERNNLRKCLIYALEEQGHTTEIIVLETSKRHNILEKDAKEVIRKRQADEIDKAEPYTDINEANRIARGSPKTSIMRRVEKTRILDRLPGIENSSVWNVEFIDNYLKDRDFINRHQNFYLLENAEVSRKRSEVNWFYKATSEHQFLAPMARDVNPKIWAYQQLNLMQFLDGREYHKDSQEVIDFYDKAINDPDIASCLGTIPKATVGGKERIQLVRKCLASIGVNLSLASRKLVDGVRQRCYSLDHESMNCQVRVEILAAIDRKFTAWLQSESVKKVCWEESPVVEVAEAAATEAVNNQHSTVMSQESAVNSQQTVDEEWFTPENLQITAGYLDACEDPEMLADLREEIKIPAPVLVVAARQLPEQKREIIRQWVTA